MSEIEKNDRELVEHILFTVEDVLSWTSDLPKNIQTNRFIHARYCAEVLESFRERLHDALVSAPLLIRMGILRDEKIGTVEAVFPDDAACIRNDLISALSMQVAIVHLKVQKLTVTLDELERIARFQFRFENALREIVRST
ncbi:MAG: hypothetical protein ABL890_02140 [Candidatus Peribacteraceae bacterium]